MSVQSRKAFAAFLVSVTFLSSLGPQASAQQSRPAYPVLNVQAGIAGQQALDAIGAQLGSVAAWYGWSAETLRNELLADRQGQRTRLDAEGRLYVEEEFGRSEYGHTGHELTPTHDTNETFWLESKPFASRNIVLDFNGATLSGTKWNTAAKPRIVLPGFKVDADLGELTDDTHARIHDIWTRVSENFASLDVNVTTVEAFEDDHLRENAADERYGVSVVITRDLRQICESCDGAVYVNSLGDIGSGRHQLLVNAAALGNLEPGTVATAITHLLGHALGLRDDVETVRDAAGVARLELSGTKGSGENTWAPIMGHAFDATVRQFSKGEYPDAANQEDDFAVMVRNGLPLRPDDHGFSRITSTPLESTLTAGRMKGQATAVVERANDWDTFSINADAGVINASVTSATANLALAPYDAHGRQLALVDAPGSLGATLTKSVARAGTYYLQIRSTSPANALIPPYGNRGRYELAADYPPTSETAAAACFVPQTGSAPAALDFAINTPITFAATASDAGGIAHYAWHFGDGTQANPSAGNVVLKSFTRPGTYTVRLRVLGNDGFNTVSTQRVRIHPTQAAAQAAIFPPRAIVSVLAKNSTQILNDVETVRGPVTLYVDATRSIKGSPVPSCGPQPGNDWSAFTVTLSNGGSDQRESPGSYSHFEITEAGSYTVSVKVQDKSGRTSQPVTKTVTVTN